MPISAIISHWYVWAILAGGFALVGAIFIKKTTHRVEIGLPSQDRMGAKIVQMETAEAYASQLGDMSKEVESLEAPPVEPTPQTSVEGNLGRVFAEAIKEKVRSTVLESDVSLAINAPIKVEGGELKVDIPDGEVGQIVMKAKKSEAPVV